MTNKAANRRAPRRPQSNRGAHVPALIPAVLYAFGCGMGIVILLLAGFAFLFEHFSLSVALVRPLALAAAWCGAAASGWVLAARLGKAKLLCGLMCGVFYCVCLLLASLLLAGGLDWTAFDAALPIALLLGGLIGGTLNALHTVPGTVRH